MFNTIFDTTATGLDIKTVLICAGAALILGIAIAFTHMKTSQTTKGFLTTLAVLPLLVMAVMIMINGNLGTSIAILGAFSLIRFRSIQGQAKDLLSVFFAMMIGLALGMGHLLFATVITAIAILFDQSQCVGIDDKLLVHSRTFGSLVVSLREIADCHAL